MAGSALGVFSALLCLLLQPGVDSNQPVTWSPSSQELDSLQELLERLKEKFRLEDLEDPDHRPRGTGGSPHVEPTDTDARPSNPLDLQAIYQGDEEEQWVKFLASPKRRRHFSGCFGTRLERIGTQTGLGCHIYKARSRRKSRS